MENTIRFTKLADTDKHILLYLDFDDLINLIKIDKVQRSLIYYLLPEIIKNNNTYSTRPIKFLVDLLEIGEFAFVKKILNNLTSGHAVFTNLFDYIDVSLYDTYIHSAPKNYKWTHFMNTFLDFNTPPSLQDLITINHFLEAAKDADNQIIVDLITEYWQNEELDEYLKQVVKTQQQLLKMKKLLNH